MKQIKTVIRLIGYAGEFDEEVNRLLFQGWTLTKRTTMSMPGVLTDAFSSGTEQALYAELERMTQEYPEEITV